MRAPPGCASYRSRGCLRGLGSWASPDGARGSGRPRHSLIMKAGLSSRANGHRSAPTAWAGERRGVFLDDALRQRVLDGPLVGRTFLDQAAGHQAGAEAIVARSRQDRVYAPNAQGLIAIERVGQTLARHIGKIAGN